MSGRWQLSAHYTHSPPHSNIGPKLRAARLARGLTLADLANKLGFPVLQIEAIERGQTEDQLPALIALSLELDLELKDLFGSTLTRPVKPVTPNRIRLH